MSDYTPTTEQVEFAYANDSEDEYRDPIGYPALVRQNKVAFRRWLAAHDAAKRAEWEAEQGETEWEYGHDCDESRATHHKNPSPQNPWQSMGTCTSATDYRRRKAGPWLPVPDTTNNESEGKA